MKFLRPYKAHTLTDSHFAAKLCIDNRPLELEKYNIDPVDGNLYKVKIKSRMVSGQTYFVLIYIDNRRVGLDKIVETFCDCASGQRTITCCNHVGAAIWLLVRGLEENRDAPASHLNSYALKIVMPQIPEGDESTDEALSE